DRNRSRSGSIRWTASTTSRSRYGRSRSRSWKRSGWSSRRSSGTTGRETCFRSRTRLQTSGPAVVPQEPDQRLVQLDLVLEVQGVVKVVGAVEFDELVRLAVLLEPVVVDFRLHRL